MTASNLDDTIWQKLKEQAIRKGVTPETLLQQLLNDVDQPEEAQSSWLHTYTPQMMDHLSEAIAVFDREMRYLAVNNAWIEQYGLTGVSIIGKSHYEVFPEIGDEWKAIHRRCLQGDIDINDRAPFPRASGHLDWVRWQVRPWYEDAAQTVIGGLVMITCVITDDIKAEGALWASERRYRALFEQSTDAVVLTDLQGNVVDANPAFLELSGYQVDEIRNLHRLQFTPDSERADSERRRQQLLSGNMPPPYERTLIRKDGQIVSVELNVSLINDENDVPLYVQTIARDITERKRTEAALRASEERYRLLSDVTFEGIVLNEMGTIRDVNKAMSRMFGYEREELIGQNGIDLFFPPEYRAEIRQKVITQYVKPYEVVAVRKDGSRFPVEIEARQLDGEIRVASLRDITERKEMERDLLIKESAMDSSLTATALADLNGMLTYVNGAFLKLWEYDHVDQILGRSVLEFWASSEAAQRVVNAILEQGFYVGELVALRSDGTQADVELAASVVTDNDGQPVCMMGSFIDVTGRKQTERVTLDNERLKVRFQKEQERNQLIQRLVSMLSHDLRTPLAVIASARDLLERYYDRISDEKRREKLVVIGRQVQFALEILQDTVNVARGNLHENVFDPRPINLAALCRVSVDEIQISEKSQHLIHFINHIEHINQLVVDEILVSRILLNLLGNAIKYSMPDQPITLELDKTESEIILRVIDHGMGIDDADKPYIFEPFYRSKQTQNISGTGLGLSIVRDCVLRHQGQIHVESTPGQGTTFIVELPLKSES